MHGPRFSASTCARQKGAVERDGCSRASPTEWLAWRYDGATSRGLSDASLRRFAARLVHSRGMHAGRGIRFRFAALSMANHRRASFGFPDAWTLGRGVDQGMKSSGEQRLGMASGGARPRCGAARTDDRRRSVRSCGCKGPVRAHPAGDKHPFPEPESRNGPTASGTSGGIGASWVRRHPAVV